LNVFEPSCHNLQTEPGSPFLRTLTVQRRDPDRHIALRGLVRKVTEPTGIMHKTLPDVQAFLACLKHDFGLDLSEIARLWPELERRHIEQFPG